MTQKPCGLICGLPASLHSDWAGRLGDLTKDFRPAALVLEAPHQDAALKALIEAANALDLGVLLRDALEKAAALNASGVYFSETAAPSSISEARERLGTSAIIGAESPLTRHDGMERAEAGADFITFAVRSEDDLLKAADLSAWWDEMMQIPSAIAISTILPPFRLSKEAAPDFLLLTEQKSAGESLILARELGLQSEA